MRELDLIRKKSVLLKGAVPIGFANMTEIGLGQVDILVGSDGTIAGIENGLPVSEEHICLDLKGCYISPGWIDLHTHVYEGVCDIAIDPDLIGPRTGVVMLVDAGSAGEANFLGLKKYVVRNKAYPIKAFLNIGSMGLTAPNRISEISDFSHINVRRTRDCVEANRDLIKGIKVRASKVILRNAGSQPVIAAKRLAEELQLPLMVHIGEPPIYLEELIHDILGAGDIITHCFHGKAGNSLSESMPKVLDLYRLAIAKGVLLDVGHGASSFSYRSATLAIENGIKPYTVSTDLHVLNYRGPVWSLATVMSKMLACGLDLEEVLQAVTINPAHILGENKWGSLTIGAEALFTVFQIEQGTFTFKDSAAKSDVAKPNPDDQVDFVGETLLVPCYTCVGPSVFAARTSCEEIGNVEMLAQGVKNNFARA